MKFIGLLLSMAILLSLSLMPGCNTHKPDKTEANPPQMTIAASFYPIYLFTKEICRDIADVVVVNLTTPNIGCLHEYKLCPTDMLRLEKAKILVINGAGMEGFLAKIIHQRPDLQIVEAAQGIELLKDSNGQPNPHVWVSISHAISQVKNIGKQLATLDPPRAEQYHANTSGYVQKLESLKTKMHQALSRFSGHKIVTFHEAFPYFAQEFGLQIAGVIQREPGAELNAGELSQAIALVKRHGVKAVFAEPQYSNKAADVIVRETGASIYLLDPVVTATQTSDDDAYIQTMERNLAVLTIALANN